MSELARPFQGLRVLLVEDEPGLQEALTLALELEGFDVIRASDGREALARLNSGPDLIITDYMMPRMNGVELIERLRADSATVEIPVLLMSAALPRHVDSSKADAFLPKPITMENLLTAVAKLLTPA